MSPLPKLPRKDPRPVQVGVRLSEKAADQLKKLADTHNMSQADVIEYLILQEYENTNEEND